MVVEGPFGMQIGNDLIGMGVVASTEFPQVLQAKNFGALIKMKKLNIRTGCDINILEQLQIFYLPYCSNGFDIQWMECVFIVLKRSQLLSY